MNPCKIAAFLAGLTMGSAAAHAACERMDKVVSVWLPIMQTTAYYVALEEGLFEKACIENCLEQARGAQSNHRRAGWCTARISARRGQRQALPCLRSQSSRARSRCSDCKGEGSRLT